MRKEEPIEFELTDRDAKTTTYSTPRDFLIYWGRKWIDHIITDRMIYYRVDEALSGDDRPFSIRERRILKKTLITELDKLISENIYEVIGSGIYHYAGPLD